jgi:RHS repeat-associated protein
MYQLGSVRFIVNTKTDATVQNLDYDAYGRVIRETGAGFQPFGFAGGLYDATTKLVRFGAGDYYASTGRWTNKDPIGFAGQ